MEIKQYWSIIWKRKFLILLSVAVCFAIGGVFSYIIMQPKFRATSKILVEPRAKMVVFMGETPRNMPPALDIETYVKMLKSLKVGEMAAMNLGWPEPKKAAANIVAMVDVQAEEDTGIIRINVDGPNPKECKEIANAYANAFETMSIKMGEDTLNEVESFIKKQLVIAKQNLRKHDEQYERFQDRIFAEQDTTDPDIQEVQLDLVIRMLETEKMRAEIEEKTVEAQLNGLTSLLGKYRINLRDFDNLQDGQHTIDDKLREIELERISLSRKYTNKHPKIVEIDEKIRNLTREKHDYVSGLINEHIVSNGQYEDVDDQVKDLAVQIEMTRSKMARIDENLVSAKGKMQAVPAMKKKKMQLDRERAVAENLKNTLEEQLIQTQLQRVERPTKVRLLDEAPEPAEPFYPDRKKNLAISLVIGLLLGIGAAFLLEEMEESIRTSDDVKNYLNLPVLGSVPYSSETINKLITDVPLKSPIAEAYRRLSFFTQLFCLDPPIKSLLVTSSKSDEGKSTTMSNMAISMAQEGTKVLIVDTDLRRPMLHRMFGIDNSLGLSSILTGELEAEIAVSDMSTSGQLPKESFMEVVVDRLIQPANIKGLNIIPSGPLPANSIELLRSERMLSFLRTAEKKADIVIFDSPPAIHVIDAVVLSQILDGVLLIINSGRINREEALQVKYMIESTKTPIIGVALNNIEASSPDYYYYYYYGGYGYGSRQRRKRVKLKR